VVIQRVMALFYLITWCTFLFTLLGVISDAPDGPYDYVLPAVLYAALLLNFPLRTLLGLRRGEGNWVGTLWGFGSSALEQLLFVLIGFGLIAWMSAVMPPFVWLYYTWGGVSFGMLHDWRWLAAGILGAEAAVYSIQSGLFNGLLTGSLSSEDLWSYGFSAFIFVIYATTFSSLIGSRMESEHLVQQLRATQVQLEAALAQEKEVAVLRERDRMAREMHDVLGHALVLVAVKIEAAQRLQAVDPARAAAELEATKELVRQSMADLRVSLADLRSPALEADDQPLAHALGAWAERTAKAGGLALEYTFEPGLETLPAPIQDALWRVGREAILNIVKHARAQQVAVHVFRKDGAVYLSVGDDGVGIPHLAEGAARLEVEGHYGIRGMRERLAALGGQLTIRPNSDGRGTLVLAQVPLPPAAPPPAPPPRDRLSPAKSLLFGKRDV
jgi:signal transduction histidine kinase